MEPGSTIVLRRVGDGPRVVTKAAILCGGEGNRLRPLTSYFQKTMIPVGSRRRPILEYVVRLIVHNGVKDIVMLSGYRSDDITNYFGDGSRFGANIRYCSDRPGTAGSAPALVNAIKTNTFGKFDEILLYYGDVLSTLDVRALLKQHASSGADLTLVISPDYAIPVGIAEVTRGRISAFREKPNLGLKVTTGCMVISKSCVPALFDTVNDGGKDMMSAFVPAVLKRKMDARPYYLRGFWYDVGTTEAYEKLDDETVERHLRFLG
jgi:mannose-1-phosphate guanylyltransferase